jgi:hypothetical protein
MEKRTRQWKNQENKIASKIKMGTEMIVKPRKTCGRTRSERIDETKKQVPIVTWKRLG